MIEGRALAVGTPVRLRSASHLVDLRADTGQVVGFDPDDEMPIIQLDAPALYHAADGSTRELARIVEAEDNLDILE